MVYINIESALWMNTNDEYTVKVAKTPEEAIKLIEVGFEFVNQMGETALYRKRK